MAGLLPAPAACVVFPGLCPASLLPKRKVEESVIANDEPRTAAAEVAFALVVAEAVAERQRLILEETAGELAELIGEFLPRRL